jgi:hypothetical protein
LGNPHDEYELASWQCDIGDVVLVTCQFGLGDVGIWQTDEADVNLTIWQTKLCQTGEVNLAN